MHAIRSTLAGSPPAPQTRPAVAAGPDRPFSFRRIRRAASLAAIVFVLAATLGLTYTACYASRSRTASSQRSDEGNSSEVVALTVENLPATLNLSTEQRTRLMAALAEFRHNRSTIGHRFGAGARGRRPDNAGPRGHGKLDPGVQMQRGDRQGSGNGPGHSHRPGHSYRPGRGDRLDRGHRPGRGHAPGGGPGIGFEPPIIDLLEKASTILSGDQFVVLTQFVAGRRAEMRPGPGAPATPFDGPFGHFAARRLGLTDAQQDQLKPILTTFGEGMRSVSDGLQAGTLTPEQARDRAKELRIVLEQGAQGVLTPEQWKQAGTFREKRRDRQPNRRADTLPRHVDRITGMYIRVLGLDSAQTSRVRQIMEATIPPRRAVAERRAQGTLDPEDFAYEMMTIEKDAAGHVRGALNPDQVKRFDALLALLPRGHQMGGPMNGPMGGAIGSMGRAMGGPMGEPRGGPTGRHRGRR